MNKLQFEAKLATFKKFSTLPAVMAEIIRICDNPDTSMAELADIIMRDVALTTKILKVVNSPFYGFPQQVSSIKQAVSKLGTRQVKSLALSLSIHGLTKSIGSQFNQKDFWRHSLNVACVAELIAQKVDPSLVEEAFIIGCIHDIGILLLDNFYHKEYTKVFESISQDSDIVQVERQILDIDHTVAGEMLARMWNFPVQYCQAILHHHDIIDLENSSPAGRLTDIVNLADKLATFSLEQKLPSHRSNLTNREILAKNLNLSSTDLKEIEYEALSKFLKTASSLEIEVGTPTELLQQANDRLFDLYSYTESLYQQLKVASAQLDEKRLNMAAVEALQAIIATFAHYINNAITTISGRTQLLQMALSEGDIEDHKNVVAKSITVYEKGAEQISSVLDKLRQIKVFKTAIYHEDTKIIDLDNNLKNVHNDLTELLQH